MITYGIIGCGMMGQEHLRNIAILDGASVGAIYEPDAGMRTQAAKLAPEAVFVDSIDALLAQKIDCVLIVSPNHLHAAQLRQIAALRPLPVLVEKPVFTDPKDATSLSMLDYPAPIWVAMEYRYMPPIKAFLDQINSATGGPVMLSIREHRFPFLPKVGDWNRFNRNTGGTLVEKCCHFFDLMRLALGSDPVRVMASAGQAVNHLDERYDGEVPDIWDNGFVIVDFENGSRAMLELCMFAEGSRYQEELCAVGPKGKIEAHVPGPTRFWSEQSGEPPVPQLTLSPRTSHGPEKIPVPVDPVLLQAGDHNGATFYQHQKFLRAIAGEGPVEVTLKDGLWAARIGHLAQLSAQTGRALSFEGQN